MKTIANHQQNQKNKFLPYLISSFVITNVVFFIDEGFYDFRWMKSFGNWFVFALYFSVIFGVQMVFSTIFSRFFTLKQNNFWIILSGTLVAFIILFSIFK